MSNDLCVITANPFTERKKEKKGKQVEREGERVEVEVDSLWRLCMWKVINALGQAIQLHKLVSIEDKAEEDHKVEAPCKLELKEVMDRYKIEMVKAEIKRHKKEMK